MLRRIIELRALPTYDLHGIRQELVEVEVEFTVERAWRDYRYTTTLVRRLRGDNRDGKVWWFYLASGDVLSETDTFCMGHLYSHYLARAAGQGSAKA